MQKYAFQIKTAFDFISKAVNIISNFRKCYLLDTYVGLTSLIHWSN